MKHEKQLAANAALRDTLEELLEKADKVVTTDQMHRLSLDIVVASARLNLSTEKLKARRMLEGEEDE